MDPAASLLFDVALGRPPRWDAVPPEHAVSLLERHGLAGLAASDARARAGRGSDPQLPEALLDSWRVQGLRTTLITEAGSRALASLVAAGIPVMRFKGAALLLDGTYADPGARALQDVDLLVQPTDAGAAVAALERAGWVPWSPWTPSRPRWISSLSLDERGAPGGLESTVDLHWATPYGRLRHSLPRRPDTLWDGARDALPAAESHFVVIAEHFLKHLRVVSHMRGIADLARLGSRLRDADLLVGHARARGSLPGLRLVLELLVRRLGADLPPAVVREVGRPGRPIPDVLDPEALARVTTPTSRGAALRGAWGLIGTRRRSAWEVVRVLLPPPVWLRARYPEVPALARRSHYMAELARWAAGSGATPLSPGQETWT